MNVNNRRGFFKKLGLLLGLASTVKMDALPEYMQKYKNNSIKPSPFKVCDFYPYTPTGDYALSGYYSITGAWIFNL